jgi:predicted permease
MKLLRDIGYGLRQIVRRPFFSLAIILTLAIGIGPNVAIFSVLKAVMLEPMPYPEPGRLVQVWQTDIDSRSNRQPFSWPDFVDIREQSESFEAFGVTNPRTHNIGGDEPERVAGALVTADALTVWNIPPAHGRLFTEQDVEDEARLVVIADSLWRRKLGGDPAIVGESIPVNGVPYQVIGIMPPEFEFFTPWTEGQHIEVWTPLGIPEWANRGSHWLLAVARLKPGVHWRTAEAEIRGIAETFRTEYPVSNARTQVWILPFVYEVIGGMTAQVLILITAVGFVLLTACANVGSMLLARGADRKTEVAIRGSVGAGTRRILTQLLTEAGLLSVIGGAAGVLMALWSVDLIKAIIPPEVPRAAGIAVDSTVLVFALVLTLLTGLLFGLVPALIASRTDIASTLREGSGTVTATKRRNRMLRVLAVAQIAVAFLLANGAILLYTSYKNILDIPFSFDTENVITARILLPKDRYEDHESRVVFWERLLERLQGMPGIERAAMTTKLPMKGGNNSSILTEDQSWDPQVRRRLVERSWISPDYFEAMGIPLLAGRVFETGEGDKEQRTIVVNKALADYYFPDTDPIGQVIRHNLPEPDWTATIVGVVANVPQWGPIYRALPEWYASNRITLFDDSFLVVRSTRSPDTLMPAIQEVVLELDRDLPLAEPRTMAQVLREATGGRQFLTTMVSLFAIIALILAMAGIFGTMSHNVAQRTREIGVRVAFGAHRRRILTMVLREGLLMDVAGIGLGIFALFSFSMILRSQLYGVGPVNLLYGGAAALLLALVTLVATVLPALRASRVDPMKALRFE